MLAEILEDLLLGRLSEPLAAARPLLREQRHRAVQPDLEHLVDAGEVGVGAVMKDERAIAAEPRRDRCLCLGMLADEARQVQQQQRLLQVDRIGVPALRQRRSASAFSSS